MLALLEIYRWTILAGTLAAGALALLGCHLAARDKAMQTLCVGQGATLGVLMGIGLLQTFAMHPEGVWALGPFGSAALFSLATFQISEIMVRHKDASKSTLFLSLFAVLLALGYLTSALFPALENHMTQIFFGDVATMSNFDSILTSCLSLIIVGILTIRWKAVSNESFETATFGNLRSPNATTGHPMVFHMLALVTLCYAVQFLGFLFTISCLFIPTGLLRFTQERRLRRHFVFAVLTASSSSFIGFLISLSQSRLPTVPTIVAFLLLELLCLIVWDKLRAPRILEN